MRRRRLALGLGMLAIAMLVGSYAFLWTSMGWPWDGFHWLPPSGGATASRTMSARGVSQVVIDTQTAAAVQVESEPGSAIRLVWSCPGQPARALTLTRQGATVRIVFRPPPAVNLSFSLFRQPTAILDVTLPPGLSLTSESGTGSLAVQGTFHQVVANVEVGTLYVYQFVGALDASVGTGALGVEGATIEGPLTLSTRLGVVDFWGDPGRSATVYDNLGPVNLRLLPRARLVVSVRVGFGSFTTAGFAGLQGSNRSGVYVGKVGQGAPGTLSVNDLSGGVTLVPYQPQP